MSTSFQGPQITAPEIDAWLLAVAARHTAIHQKAAHAWHGHAFHEAFTDMSVLFLEAFEEVRVVSEQLREESSTTRSRSIALRDHYAQLLEQSVAAMERLAQFIPPTPGETSQTESQMPEMFRAGHRRKKQHG
jgi:hypothetical protein